jgi:hypothetical protein
MYTWYVRDEGGNSKLDVGEENPETDLWLDLSSLMHMWQVLLEGFY